MNPKNQLAVLPSIDYLLNFQDTQNLSDEYSRILIKETFRKELEILRNELLLMKNIPTRSKEEWALICVHRAEQSLQLTLTNRLKQVINATGIILHTGLGRAPFSEKAQKAVCEIIQGYCNLELDLQTGKRGVRLRRAASAAETRL